MLIFKLQTNSNDQIAISKPTIPIPFMIAIEQGLQGFGYLDLDIV